MTRDYYIVRVINRDATYAEESAYGPFTTREKAQEWADKAEKILARSPDAVDLFATVDSVERPLLRSVRENYVGQWEATDNG